MPTPNESLDITARAAHVEQPTSVDNLTQAVLKYPHSFPIPSPIGDLLASRLSQAETAYRNGLGPGVSEKALLALMNQLADKLHLPGYARVTPTQLRVLRMQLVIRSPVFMGAGLARPNMTVGSAISDTMSPLQAMHILATMLDQKISNPDYQDPSIDLVHTFQQRQMENEKARASGAKITYKGVCRENPRNTEMRKSIASGIQSLSLQDAYDLVDQAFTTVNLE
jgi:hypothetical protein